MDASNPVPATGWPSGPPGPPHRLGPRRVEPQSR
jgi:hypothetical protein